MGEDAAAEWASLVLSALAIVISFVSASKAVKASRFVVRSNRFADHQIRKRESYGAVLIALRNLQFSASLEVDRLAVFQSLVPASLVSNDDLASHLNDLSLMISDGRDDWKHESYFESTQKLMRRDVSMEARPR